jgi:hypothetical protein
LVSRGRSFGSSSRSGFGRFGSGGGSFGNSFSFGSVGFGRCVRFSRGAGRGGGWGRKFLNLMKVIRMACVVFCVLHCELCVVSCAL